MKKLFVLVSACLIAGSVAKAADVTAPPSRDEVAKKVAIALPLNAEISGVLGVITTQRHIICIVPTAQDIMVDVTRGPYFVVTYACKGPQEEQKLIVSGTYEEQGNLFSLMMSSVIINF